jgi:hypothetical protein
MTKKATAEVLKNDLSTGVPHCLTNNYVDEGYHWPPVPWIVRYLFGQWYIGFRTRPYLNIRLTASTPLSQL